MRGAVPTASFITSYEAMLDRILPGILAVTKIRFSFQIYHWRVYVWYSGLNFGSCLFRIIGNEVEIR